MFVEGAPGTREPRRPTPPHHVVDGSEFGRLAVLYGSEEAFNLFTPSAATKQGHMAASDDLFARWFGVAEHIEINGVKYEFTCTFWPESDRVSVKLERTNVYDKWGHTIPFSRRHGSPAAVKVAHNLIAPFVREWATTSEAERVKQSTTIAYQEYEVAYLRWQREALATAMRKIDKQLAEALGHDLSDLIDIHHDLSNHIKTG